MWAMPAVRLDRVGVLTGIIQPFQIAWSISDLRRRTLPWP